MHILAIGVATLDIVNRVDVFPEEDQEIRATAQQLRRGGNACNSLTVLSRLGHRCSWAGMLADDEQSKFIKEALIASAIDTRWASVETGSVTPTSYIISSQATGSRTIVHYRNLPEYNESHFSKVELSAFDWLHFEGRNPQATLAMLKRVREQGTDARVSIELEKPRDDLEQCLSYADVVMVSRAYALAKGLDSAQKLFDYIASFTTRALCFLAWGEEGGWFQTGDNSARFLPAFKPPQVIDTLGAGDVFNAGLIHGLYHWDDPMEALRYAIQAAGEKCGREGL
ncbi:MAG: PfkB family carbohydrate kinase [Candidatus Thiodiazotropha sp. 6PLUC2]